MHQSMNSNPLSGVLLPACVSKAWWLYYAFENGTGISYGFVGFRATHIKLGSLVTGCVERVGIIRDVIPHSSSQGWSPSDWLLCTCLCLCACVCYIICWLFCMEKRGLGLAFAATLGAHAQ